MSEYIFIKDSSGNERKYDKQSFAVSLADYLETSNTSTASDTRYLFKSLVSNKDLDLVGFGHEEQKTFERFIDYNMFWANSYKKTMREIKTLADTKTLEEIEDLCAKYLNYLLILYVGCGALVGKTYAGYQVRNLVGYCTPLIEVHFRKSNNQLIKFQNVLQNFPDWRISESSLDYLDMTIDIKVNMPCGTFDKLAVKLDDFGRNLIENMIGTVE